MEVIILRLRNLGFKVKIVTQMTDEDTFFITHIEAHQNGGAYISSGFVHKIATPPESELRVHLQKAENTIEAATKAADNVLKQEKPIYKRFHQIPMNWVPVGDIHNPNA